jgi:hypothetical protein
LGGKYRMDANSRLKVIEDRIYVAKDVDVTQPTDEAYELYLLEQDRRDLQSKIRNGLA